MKIILSPAKKMKADPDPPPYDRLPALLDQTERLLRALRTMDDGELRRLWRCSDAIAAQNRERVRKMDLRRGLIPALLAFDGIQYRYMAPGVFENRQFDYVREHLCILSGFYGLLRPFDGVTPYRLEMQAKLRTDGFPDLYAFWGDQPARLLFADTDWVLNLASREYSRAVTAYRPDSVRLLTCAFGERRGNTLIEKGTLCKMARGEMVRWLSLNNITRPDAIREFRGLGYAYCADLSQKDRYAFIKKGGTNHAASW